MSDVQAAARELDEMQQAAQQVDITANFTEDDRTRVAEIVKTIDVEDTGAVLTYGSDAQAQISKFSDEMLSRVRTKDSEAIGELLSSLVAEIEDIDRTAGKKSSFFSRFRKNATKTMAKYNSVEANVDNIVKELDDEKSKLMQDVVTFDAMYQENLDFFKNLTVYIAAGEEKIKELREVTLPEARKKAEESGLQDDAQYANDLENKIARFEKKIHDLKLTRMVSLQMGPQIRLIQNNDTQMIEKIQSSILNTIPLWKSQIVIGLGVSNINKAVEAQKAVTDMTNKLLQQNSEMLKTGTVSVAQESERSIIDVETVHKTNVNLIETIDSVKQIQAQGAAARVEAAQELARLENELKNKLLEMKNSEQ